MDCCKQSKSSSINFTLGNSDTALLACAQTILYVQNHDVVRSERKKQIDRLQEEHGREMNSRGIENLSTLCRNVIVSNLERYPGEAFAILDEQEWDNLVKLKHTSTRPRLGKGGLDGSGRMNPVVSDKFITEVEENVPHFAYSEIVDTLVWKDLVNFRFKPGGLSRPKR